MRHYFKKSIKVEGSKYNKVACHGFDCTDDKALGRLAFSSVMGMGDANKQGVYGALYSFGARSFSI